MSVVFIKVMKVMPVTGYFFVLAEAPVVLKRKGYVLGTLAVALDMIPVICLVKAGVEIFTGDLIPDRDEAKLPQTIRRNLEAAA